MQISELELAQKPINEEDHLFSVFCSKKYRGWYRFVFDSLDDQTNTTVITRQVFIRFRLPEILAIYGIARRFTMEERQVGIHRMLIGKDLRAELEQMLKHESVNDYIETLSDEQVKEITNRAEKVITFDCNKIPYLNLSYKIPSLDSIKDIPEELEKYNSYEKKIEKQIKDYIEQYPDYVKMFMDVLNEKKTVQEVAAITNNVISCEFIGVVGNDYI